MDHDEILRRRRERAARWASHDLHGYPAVSIEDETEGNPERRAAAERGAAKEAY